MKDRIGWGILGPGTIAAKFAADLRQLDDARLAAVGSRSAERAAAFAQAHGFEHACSSYVELVEDPDVDVVYVATPHPFHREHALLCLRHNKSVLCEKPMAVNEAQVREMVTCARERGVFLMEAMWTRALPVMRQVQRWLDEARIGDVRMLTADFGFRTGWNPEGRLLNLDLAGGALLDVGVYTVALASMVFGAPPVEIRAAAHIGETGVDEQTAMVLRYGDGALALLSCAVRTDTPQGARIGGAEGSIDIPAFWHATSATLRVRGQEPEQVSGPVGYHYEAAEVMACLRGGNQESSLMPLAESISIARTMEHVRAQIGLVYPMEAGPS
jgi:dihydrodiol dehydrogenase / D-xylose 1-dehydrogenase (NADP)